MAVEPDAGPVPLSFPAILRNPRLGDRFAHEDPPQSLQRRARKDRPEPEGKRWVRRRENGAFHRTPSPPRLTVHSQVHTQPTHRPPHHRRLCPSTPAPFNHLSAPPACLPAPLPSRPFLSPSTLPPSHILRWPLLPLLAWRPPYPPRPSLLGLPCESHRDPPCSMAPRRNILEPRSGKGSPPLSRRPSRRQGRHQGSR
jgi:hypothetical protein